VSDRCVVFFGDDIVAGARDATSLGLVGRLVSAAFDARIPVSAYNLGVLADTSIGVSRRWRREAGPRIDSDTRWWPVFCFGANDTAAHGGATRVDQLASVQALQKVLARTLDAGLAPLIIGPPPIGDAAQRERTVMLSGRFADMCSQHGVPYCETSVALLSSPTWTGDLDGHAGLPGAAGYEELASLVIAAGWLAWLR
jgi:lysophospholipase L1-like esterase